MCGIAGVLRRDGRPADERQVKAMVRAMPHRGPDGRGTWADGPVALGHARLSVRDLGPAARQPMEADHGSGVLVYNGEVYDEGPLRAELEREGVRFHGTGDAEVVCAALARWGVLATLPRFDGMFALAWWDARARALWLARDRFGIKPLDAVVTADRVLFASELRGLRAIDGVARKPDLVELTRAILPTRTDLVRLPFEGVVSVPPGCAWRVTESGLEEHRWFDPVRDLDLDRLLAADRESPEVWEARIEGALRDAVRSHLASDVPLAAFTSGGVDSNLVAALAREHAPGLVAYTADTVHAESEIDDAKRAADAVGVSLRVVPVGREDTLRLWPEAAEALEVPARHPSQPAMLALCRAAKRDGFTVIVTGEGSDELFGGYDFFGKTWERWRRAHVPPRCWTRKAARERKWLSEAPFDYEVARRDPEVHLRLAASLAAPEDARARETLARLAAIPDRADRAFTAHGLDSLRRHLDRILLRHDRLGMAASLELRVPFLSWRVADVGLHLPRRAKYRRGVGKWALKRVAARRLPEGIVYAEKRGFVIPDDHHRGVTSLLRGGVVPELFRWPKDAEDRLLPRIEEDAVLRHQIASLEIWGRLFLRGESASSIAGQLCQAPSAGQSPPSAS